MTVVVLPSPVQLRWDASNYCACKLCDHSQRGTHELSCSYPAAVALHSSQSVTLARAAYGSCGPEARHMHFDGLYA